MPLPSPSPFLSPFRRPMASALVHTSPNPSLVGLPIRVPMAFFGYSAYDSIRKPPKKRSGESFHSSSALGHDTHRRGAQRVFPETLKSGRPKQQTTRSQRVYAPNMAEEPPDTRFYHKLRDYREVQDGDPYAGVFHESISVRRRRVREWQRQFEAENAEVELPYERTNVLARLAPNWFVRYFVNMRDRGGADNARHLFVFGLVTLSLLWLVSYMSYTPPSQARPIAELR